MKLRKMPVMLALLAVAACGTEDQQSEGPTKEERACSAITELTPGILENGWSMEVLADPASTPEERTDALVAQMDSGTVTVPYTCDGPVFERYLAEFEQ